MIEIQRTKRHFKNRGDQKEIRYSFFGEEDDKEIERRSQVISEDRQEITAEKLCTCIDKRPSVKKKLTVIIHIRDVLRLKIKADDRKPIWNKRRESGFCKKEAEQNERNKESKKHIKNFFDDQKSFAFIKMRFHNIFFAIDTVLHRASPF